MNNTNLKIDLKLQRVIIIFIILFSYFKESTGQNDLSNSLVTIGIRAKNEKMRIVTDLVVNFLFNGRPIGGSISNKDGIAKIKVDKFYLKKPIEFEIDTLKYLNPTNRVIIPEDTLFIIPVTLIKKKQQFINKKKVRSTEQNIVLWFYSIDKNGNDISNYSCKLYDIYTKKCKTLNINSASYKFTFKRKEFVNRILKFELQKNGYLPIKFLRRISDEEQPITVKFEQVLEKPQPFIKLVGNFYDYHSNKSLSDVLMKYKIGNHEVREIKSNTEGLIKLNLALKYEENKFSCEKIIKKGYKIKEPIRPLFLKIGVNYLQVGLEKKSLYFKKSTRTIGIALAVSSIILSLYYDSEYNKEAADYHSMTYGTFDEFNKVWNNMEYLKSRRNFLRNILLPLGLASFSVSFVID